VTDPKMEATQRMRSRGRRTTPPSRQRVEVEHESPAHDTNEATLAAGNDSVIEPLAGVDPPPKPRLRGRFHQAAFFAAIPAGVTLVALAPTATARTAAAVYVGSLAGLFGVSGAYHRLRWSPRLRAAMKRADHSMIYVLIAGTITPISLLALKAPWSFIFLGSAWAVAAVGITLKMIRVDGFSVLTGMLYVALGWSAVVFLPQLARRLSAVDLGLVVVGGLLYTGGAIVFLRKRPDPRPATFGYHEIWHSFVVVGSVCHYIAVLLLILPARAGLG
jgi:hemolysin III